ncbi:hypothetical protein GGF32_003071 [Allomyces javanicus]|nr:hypothetical protein GGF32_003071 [Allomyces javanicus]
MPDGSDRAAPAPTLRTRQSAAPAAASILSTDPTLFDDDATATPKLWRGTTLGHNPSAHLAVAQVEREPLSWSRVKWPSATVLVVSPFLAVYWGLTTPLGTKTLVWSILFYAICATGVTAGYHRLWAHRAYSAAWPYRLWMALAGAGSIQGSIRWWARGHRAHHRFTDTDKDPYSAQRGLLWSHFLWMLFNPDRAVRVAQRQVDMADLDADPIVRYQHQYYAPISIFTGLVFPTLVAGYGWGDFWGGFVWAGWVRMVLLHHATFCVNSLAHYLGEATYDDRRSPRDHLLTALVTMGEGMHNFHHEFPNDYRNAIRWYEWDPTKIVIYLASLVGLTYDLKTFPDNEVQKGRLIMRQKRLDKWRAQLDWGAPVESLPLWSVDRWHEELKLNPMMLVIDGIALDVSLFIHDHPGGTKWIKLYLGKNATRAFNGGIYMHATAARNLMSRLRVARVYGLGADEAEAASDASGEQARVALAI